MGIQVTDSAIRNARRLREKEGHAPDSFLRVGVKGGGCSGYSYVLLFESEAKDNDEIVREDDAIQVRCDPKSMMFLEGLTLDFSEGINGKGFEFVNPKAKSTCGCGQSFSV